MTAHGRSPTAACRADVDRTASAPDPVVDKVLRKVFPTHFSFLWGELALYSFVVLLITGIYLTLFFEGSQERLVYTGSYAPAAGRARCRPRTTR